MTWVVPNWPVVGVVLCSAMVFVDDAFSWSLSGIPGGKTTTMIRQFFVEAVNPRIDPEPVLRPGVPGGWCRARGSLRRYLEAMNTLIRTDTRGAGGRGE